MALYSPLVYSWGRRSGLGPEDAADLLQEVFRAVFRSVSNFSQHRPGSTFRGWLRTIARNKIRDHFRAKQGRLEAVGGEATQFLELLAEERESQASLPVWDGLVERALDLIRGEFEHHTWQAFWEAIVEERDTQEIAGDLNMTCAAVRQAKCRVLRRLRQQLIDRE